MRRTKATIRHPLVACALTLPTVSPEGAAYQERWLKSTPFGAVDFGLERLRAGMARGKADFDGDGKPDQQPLTRISGPAIAVFDSSLFYAR